MEAVIGILMDAFFVGLLIWCSYWDLRKRIVSNRSVLLLLCLGITHMALMFITGNTWWQYPASLLLAIPFFIIWMKNGIGAGDVKLMIAIALYLGLLNTLLSFALMIPVLVFLMARSWRKSGTVKYRIPFAPVLAFGAVETVLLGYLYALAGI